MRVALSRKWMLFLALLIVVVIGVFAAWSVMGSTALTSQDSLRHATVPAPAGIDGKTVYLGTTGGLVALNARTGATRWRYPAAQASGAGQSAPVHPRVTSMALCDGTLYVALINGPVVALRASDGAPLWSSSLAHESNTPTVACASGTVYVAAHVGTPQATSDHWLFALRASDGHELWRFVADEPILSAPAVVAGDVVFGTTDRLLYVVDGQTGALRWRSGAYSAGSVGAHLENFDYAKPLGIAIMAQGTTIYINAKIEYRNNAGRSYIEPDVFVRSLDAQAGERLGAPPEGLPAAYPPVVAGGVSYSEGGGGLWASSLDGSARPQVGWYHQSDGTQYTGPTLGDGRLYVCAFNGDTYALSARDGHELWRAHTNGGALSQPPAFTSGVVFVDGGSVAYALRASDGAPIWRTSLAGGPIWLSPLVG